MKNKNAIILAAIAVLLVSSLSLAIESASAIQPNAKSSNKPVQTTYVRINGVITQWGDTPVKGLLQTQARTALLQSQDTKQLASAAAIWTTNTSRPIQSVRAHENFTFVFYVARLTNASVSTLGTSSSGVNYFLNGTWTLGKVVSTVTVITNADGNITRVIRHQDITPQRVYGELTVTDNWSTFTLTLTGQDVLSGSVFRSVTRQAEFNPFKLTDDSMTNKVNGADLGAVMRIYGSMPGWGSYDTRMDFNNNYQVDIADLSTVAGNM
jgi:hypothetical protein